MILNIFIAGDSTAAQKTPDVFPETGWGQKFTNYVKSDVKIYNQAMNGRSTKSFIDENRLNEIDDALCEGDYLFIQFGHNDQKKEDVTRYTSPFDTYASNLMLFADVAKKNGAYPVFLTSVTRRDYLPNQQLNPNTLGDYPSAVCKVANDNQIPLLDIFKESQLYFNRLSPEDTKNYYLHGDKNEFLNYPDGIEDNTHFQEAGADIVAKLVASEILKSNLALKNSIIVEKLTLF